MTKAVESNSQSAAEELRSFVERYERLESEKKDVADSQKEVMSEAKGRGYDTKVLRKVIALRKRDPNDVAEEEAVFDMYAAALGMGGAYTSREAAEPSSTAKVSKKAKEDKAPAVPDDDGDDLV
jgi:uncharacterized protein (UPF0335 family)